MLSNANNLFKEIKNIEEVNYNEALVKKKNYRNSIKIYIFFLEWIIELFVNSISKQKRKIVIKSKKGKKKNKRKNSLNSNASNDSQGTKQTIININDYLKFLNILVSSHIENLFKNKIIENEVLTTVIKSLLNLLKLTSSKVRKEFALSSNQTNEIFSLLSSLITQFKYNTDIEIIMQNLSTSLVELIYTNETLIKNLSKFLSSLSTLSNSIFFYIYVFLIQYFSYILFLFIL